MNSEQRKILIEAFCSFNVTMDLDDYVGMGKFLVIRRRLAELLKLDLKECLLPGEYLDDEEIEHRFSEPLQEKSELSDEDKNYLIRILNLSDGLSGCNDTDDACLRCARRRIAEVAGIKDLSKYFLLGEKSLNNIYYPVPSKVIN